MRAQQQHDDRIALEKVRSGDCDLQCFAYQITMRVYCCKWCSQSYFRTFAGQQSLVRPRLSTRNVGLSRLVSVFF
jgi:hypothetical protein